jgi:hypothetical protein
MHTTHGGGEHVGHPGQHRGAMWRPPFMRRPPLPMIFFFLFVNLFWMAAATCFLGALRELASAQKTQARLKALKQMPDAFTEEEREVLIHKVKARAIGLY